MSQKDDALHIPIEIKTDDLQEIKDLINDITEAESDLTRIKGGTQSQSFAGQSRAASGIKTTTEGRGGIFESTLMEGDTMPMNLRDRSGKQAHTRENSFNALQDQVDQMQEEQGEQVASMFDQAFGLAGGYAPFMAMNKFSGPFQQKVMPKVKQKMQNMGMGMASAAAGSGVTAKIAGAGVRSAGMLARVATMAAGAGPIGLVVAGVVTAILAGKAFIDWAHGPGGIWDLRYKRKIAQELDPFFDRKDKQEINAGLRTIRVTSMPAVRGQSQVHSTQDMIKRGIPIYNREFEAFSKGLFL
mgnify:FL=1|tara:strand:+ start:813 stop:1712 length:900 start_codon:yes stop_codon:yes gene_type:complete